MRSWRISYRTHDGYVRRAYVLLPAWYGPHNHPRIPLIVSPHGRGVDARANLRLWGGLPALGPFAVVNPEGQGRRLPLFSWGYWGQIADLARMPAIVKNALPWIRLDRRRTYAVGGSMGAQEALLLAARHPHLLAGVISFDAATDLAARYRAFVRIRCRDRCRRLWDAPVGVRLRELARKEVGGSPAQRPYAYAARSPITYARSLARSGVAIQLWWSVSDGIVVDQRRESGRLFDRIRRWNPDAPVVEFIGRWRHTEEMHYSGRLRIALARFGLLSARDIARECGMAPGPNDTLHRTDPHTRPPIACLMFESHPNRRQPQPWPRPVSDSGSTPTRGAVSTDS